MHYDRLFRQLIDCEGYERKPYMCTAGKLTIGVGFNLQDVGLYPEEIDFILKNRVAKVEEQLRNLPAWCHCNGPRKAVLVNMAYQLGVHGLKAFKDMLNAIEHNDFEQAHDAALDSKWARKDTPIRAKLMAEQLRTGEWQ